MTRLLRPIIFLSFATLTLFACVKEDFPVQDPAQVQDPGTELAVRLGFTLNDTAPDPATRASIVGGDEGTVNPETGKINLITDLKLLCFTKEGIYLGYRTATLIGDEEQQTFNDGCLWGRELFEGTVPPQTSRIHFVGNVPESKIPGNDQIGGTENTLIRSAKMSMTTADRSIAYWGFHGEANPDLMRDWLAVHDLNGYHKREGSIVHLIRDRARIEFGSMTDVYGPDNNIEYKILSIDWIATNGRDHGYIAPYNEANPADRFTGYFEGPPPRFKHDRLTEYARPDVQRYSAWTGDGATQNGEAEMMRIWDPENGTYNHPLFLFEDKNDQVERPKIILRVRYQKDRNSTDPADQVTKYHTLMMMDLQNTPMKVYRNQKYRLDIESLPWSGMGYMTFKEAVESKEYSNNKTVSINEQVTDVNDGKFRLTIDGKGTLIFQNQSDRNQPQTVQFSYTAVDTDVSTEGLTTDNFTAEWTAVPSPSFAGETVTVTSYDPVTGNGTLQFTVGTVINNELQSGKIKLSAQNSGLTRYIHVYCISKFNFTPSTGLHLVPTGGTRVIRNTSCPTYKLELVVPGDYPEDLYPIKIRMATTTLNPFRCDIDGVEQPNATFGVEMESTENGAVLDGEPLSGMSFSTTPNLWNYRESGKPWNFWYTYVIATKPSGSVEQTHYTIYFDDTRPLRAPANRASSVGLFLKIKYFGDAVAVTTAP